MERRHRVSRGPLFVAAVVAAGLLGCGGSRDQAEMTADLERDLDLALRARSPRTMVVSVLEGGPPGAPSGTARGRRDAVPTPRPAPRPAVEGPTAETAAADAPEAATSSAEVEPIEPATAPTPEPATEQPVAAPEPATDARPADHGPTAEAGEADGRGEVERGQGRRGAGWGTLIGVIIRGGAAGIDNCEAHDRRRAGRRRPGGYGGDIIAIGGGMGGVIGGVVTNGGIRPTFPRD